MYYVNHLSPHVDNAAGYERRIQPIVQKAIAILADQLTQRWPAQGIGSVNIERLRTAPMRLNLNVLSDKQAAEQIAAAWLDALALKLKV